MIAQELFSSNSKISWEALVRGILEIVVTDSRIIKTRNSRTGALRCGRLIGAHFKIPDILIAFESSDLHIAQHFDKNGRPEWIPIGDDCIEVNITGCTSLPSVTPNGDVLFSIGDIDCEICSSLGSDDSHF